MSERFFMKYIPLMNVEAQNSQVDEINKAVLNVIKSGRFINGNYCEIFTDKFAQ